MVYLKVEIPNDEGVLHERVCYHGNHGNVSMIYAQFILAPPNPYIRSIRPFTYNIYVNYCIIT